MSSKRKFVVATVVSHLCRKATVSSVGGLQLITCELKIPDGSQYDSIFLIDVLDSQDGSLAHGSNGFPRVDSADLEPMGRRMMSVTNPLEREYAVHSGHVVCVLD